MLLYFSHSHSGGIRYSHDCILYDSYHLYIIFIDLVGEFISIHTEANRVSSNPDDHYTLV